MAERISDSSLASSQPELGHPGLLAGEVAPPGEFGGSCGLSAGAGRCRSVTLSAGWAVTVITGRQGLGAWCGLPVMPSGSQRKLASPVFPDDGIGARAVVSGRGLDPAGQGPGAAAGYLVLAQDLKEVQMAEFAGVYLSEAGRSHPGNAPNTRTAWLTPKMTASGPGSSTRTGSTPIGFQRWPRSGG